MKLPAIELIKLVGTGPPKAAREELFRGARSAAAICKEIRRSIANDRAWERLLKRVGKEL